MTGDATCNRRTKDVVSVWQVCLADPLGELPQTPTRDRGTGRSSKGKGEEKREGDGIASSLFHF